MPTCLKCLSLSFRIFIVPREFYLYFGGTHLRYLFLHTALEHGIVQVHPKNVSVSNKCFFKSHITCGNSSEEKKQFQRPILYNYILLDRDELLWFYFFLQSKHMVFKPYKRIICSGLIKWCSFIRLFNYSINKELELELLTKNHCDI